MVCGYCPIRVRATGIIRDDHSATGSNRWRCGRRAFRAIMVGVLSGHDNLGPSLCRTSDKAQEAPGLDPSAPRNLTRAVLLSQ
jgi:hypothetical protein